MVAMGSRALLGLMVAGLALASCATFEPETTDEPTASGSNEQAVGSSLRAAAQASQEAQNYAGAVGYYNSLYQRNRDDAAAALGLSRNLRFLGDVSQATTVIEEFLSRYPDDPGMVAEYGKAMLARGKASDAIPILARAAELAPDDWQVQSALGIAYDLVDDRDSAIEAYERALSIRPENPSVLNNLALSLAMAGNVDGGINLLRRADQQAGSTMQIRQNLALLLAMKGSLEEAERLVRADLPREMADSNMAVLARIAAKGGEASREDLARLTTIQSVPESEPIEVGALEPEVAEAEAQEPAAMSDADLAAAASSAADEAFADLMAEQEPQAQASEGSGRLYRVQLGSLPSEPEAAEQRANLLRRFPDLLADDGLEVRPVVLSTGDQVWRLYAGPFAEKGPAETLCRSLLARSADCLVTVGEGGE